MSDQWTQYLRLEIIGRRAVVVVGSEFSAGATNGAPTASWLGLLHDGIARCERLWPARASEWSQLRKDLRALDMRTPLSVASALSRTFSSAPEELARWLQESVGTLKNVHAHRQLRAIRDLKIPVLTTNYDSLLEHDEMSPLTWRQAGDFADVVAGRRASVVHLCGHWSEPGSVLLGVSSYERDFGSERVQEMLGAFADVRAALFVACGAAHEDANVHALIRSSRQIFGHSALQRFVLVHENDVEAFEKQYPRKDGDWPHMLVYGDVRGDRALGQEAFLRRNIKNLSQ